MEEFIASIVKFISNQSQEIQNQGVQLLGSDFYMQGPNREYRRFYQILGLVKEYRELGESSFKKSIQGLIKKHYNLETNAYLKDALKEGLGDMLD